MTKKTKTILLLSLVAIVLFFIIANFIVIDGCASPCRHVDDSNGPVTCINVCEEVTLLDWFLGNG